MPLDLRPQVLQTFSANCIRSPLGPETLKRQPPGWRFSLRIHVGPSYRSCLSNTLPIHAAGAPFSLFNPVSHVRRPPTTPVSDLQKWRPVATAKNLFEGRARDAEPSTDLRQAQQAFPVSVHFRLFVEI